jgi:hypothetical protein
MYVATRLANYDKCSNCAITLCVLQLFSMRVRWLSQLRGSRLEPKNSCYSFFLLNSIQEGDTNMWWLLLIAVSDFEYEATNVYATQEECVLQIDNSLDVCVAAELKIIKLPETAPITVTPIVEAMPEMGPAE